MEISDINKAFDKHGDFRLFSVWLRNQLISAGLEPVLIHTEKS